MSSAFAMTGLLVLAAFALGLVVGGLAWRSSTPPPSQPEPEPGTADDPARRRPMNQGLPGWDVRHVPDDDGPPIGRSSISRRPRRMENPTVVIGPQTFDTAPRAGRRSQSP